MKTFYESPHFIELAGNEGDTSVVLKYEILIDFEFELNFFSGSTEQQVRLEDSYFQDDILEATVKNDVEHLMMLTNESVTRMKKF
ncbi:hypothetical protein O9G_000620 [Rozella allomycis CSF55]|uniref:Uncharacterized protein n=1 Tax=Rozella allomycis (strain CSF55) TaxID=988480 RepID=A0A075AVT1_ROZAC|nr:hypothetical protein O9G_000620 [Rozella allomycis CSF55]|eukprot:EPZ34433.1 hypothetical protein O9G_000620 [Rozella allomycis CSF55]